MAFLTQFIRLKWELFNRKVLPHNLRIKDLLQIPKKRTNKYGNEYLSFMGSIVWNRLPDQYKAATSDNEFKTKVLNQPV